MFSENLTEYRGKPVVEWDSERGLAEPGGTAVRIRLTSDEEKAGQRWTDQFAAFLDVPGVSEVTALVIGGWDGIYEQDGDASPVVEALVTARERLPRLTGLFFGDITDEECEVSWLLQSDLSPLFDAFPLLEQLTIRGGAGLSLGLPRHERLQSLVIQSAGLPPRVVRQVGEADLPALEHLELWLGTIDFVDCAAVDDLRPLLSGERFPSLAYLGLRNSEIADEIALALEDAPLIGRLQTLDLSLGTLSDQGAAALLRAPLIRRLRKLDFHYHFCSPEMIFRLTSQTSDGENAHSPLSCVEIDAGDPQEAYEYVGDIYRYCAVRPKVEPPWVTF